MIEHQHPQLLRNPTQRRPDRPLILHILEFDHLPKPVELLR